MSVCQYHKFQVVRTIQLNFALEIESDRIQLFSIFFFHFQLFSFCSFKSSTIIGVVVPCHPSTRHHHRHNDDKIKYQRALRKRPFAVMVMIESPKCAIAHHKTARFEHAPEKFAFARLCVDDRAAIV